MFETSVKARSLERHDAVERSLSVELVILTRVTIRDAMGVRIEMAGQIVMMLRPVGRIRFRAIVGVGVMSV